MILLDTNVLIGLLVRGSSADRCLRGWLGAGEDLATSAIAWAELRCGPVGALELELLSRVVERRLPFGDTEAEVAAELFQAGGRRRGSLVDCMIAATALVGEAQLATANVGDFRRYEGRGLEIVPV